MHRQNKTWQKKKLTIISNFFNRRTMRNSLMAQIKKGTSGLWLSIYTQSVKGKQINWIILRRIAHEIHNSSS